MTAAMKMTALTSECRFGPSALSPLTHPTVLEAGYHDYFNFTEEDTEVQRGSHPSNLKHLVNRRAEIV